MRILSIDLGQHSLKAVEIDSAFNRYEVHEYHEILRQQDVSNEYLLGQLATKIQKKPDRIITAMPSGLVTTRNLSLPTKDRKAIIAGIAFELEDDLPFDLENAVYDFCTLSHNNNSTQIHVSATLKEHLTHYLDGLNKTEFDPDTVTSESWLFCALLNRSLDPATQQKPVLLIHTGKTRTVFYCHWNGQPVFCKEIAWGGETITKNLAAIYQITREEAEQVKTASGYWLNAEQEAAATPEQRELSIEIVKSCESLIQEIKKTLFSIRGVTHQSTHQIYLSGGPSQLPGLNSFIENEFQVPTTPLQSLSRLSNSGVSYNEQSDAALSLAAGAALSLVALDRIKPIQFRKKEFAKAGAKSLINWGAYQTIAWSALSVMVAAFISFNVQIFSYESQIKDLDMKLERSLKDYYGSVTRTQIKAYLSNSVELKNKLQKQINLNRELAKLSAPNPQTPINYLKDISGQLPRSMAADLVHFQVGSSTQSSFIPNVTQEVKVAFQVKSLEMGEKLGQIIGRTLVGVQKLSPEEILATDSSSQVWKFTFTGKTKEVK
ncbi:MAG: pilus assembly protein PilM [Xanthomonadaceae bacterium]|nr:pilus assembly protein PilM [Xanthomonadaceae bacterium]